MWSLLMLVMAVTSGFMTLVLSSRPPKPVSTTTISALWSAKYLKAMAVRTSKYVGSGPHTGEDRLDLSNEAGKIGRRDHFAIEADALADVDQMRAGVEASAIPVGAKHGRDHRASAALALGSGYVNAAELVLRVAQLLEQGPHAVQIEVLSIVADDSQSLEIAQSGEEAQGLGIAAQAVAMMALIKLLIWCRRSLVGRVGYARGPA